MDVTTYKYEYLLRWPFEIFETLHELLVHFGVDLSAP